jgi:hypothetical protein
LIKKREEDERKLNINPDKFKLEQKVGNSNNQNVQLLKPKWAGKIDVKWLTDGSFSVRPPKIFVGYADDYFYE